MDDILEFLARDELENVQAHGGPTWDRASFEAEFYMVGYCEPDLCVARRKSDGVTGTLWYVANEDGAPLVYFGFTLTPSHH